MAISHWHAGKLVLMWVVCLAIALPLFGWVFGTGLVFVPAQNSPDYAAFVENMRRERQMKLLGLLAAIMLAAVPLVISWRWLSGRERPKQQ